MRPDVAAEWSSGMAKLGTTQYDVLETLALRQGGKWHNGCGWYWGGTAATARILDTLVRRGLVAKNPPKSSRGQPVYELTEAGVDEMLVHKPDLAFHLAMYSSASPILKERARTEKAV